MSTPYYRQATDYTCGPACLRMLFEHLGKKMAEEELAVLLKTHPEWGTITDEMAVAVAHHGFFSFQKKEAFLDDITYFLSRHMPVIVDFIEPSVEDQHFSIIIGVDSQNFIFNDPWHGEGFTMPIEEFEKRWESPKNRYPKWMMVVSDTEEQVTSPPVVG